MQAWNDLDQRITDSNQYSFNWQNTTTDTDAKVGLHNSKAT